MAFGAKQCHAIHMRRLAESEIELVSSHSSNIDHTSVICEKATLQILGMGGQSGVEYLAMPYAWGRTAAKGSHLNPHITCNEKWIVVGRDVCSSVALADKCGSQLDAFKFIPVGGSTFLVRRQAAHGDHVRKSQLGRLWLQ